MMQHSMGLMGGLGTLAGAQIMGKDNCGEPEGYRLRAEFMLTSRVQLGFRTWAQ